MGLLSLSINVTHNVTPLVTVSQLNMSTIERGKFMTPEQCRAARALLGWSQGTLEERSGVARKTIADFEGGKKKRPYQQTLESIRSALEAAGVEFQDPDNGGPGVRLQGLRKGLIEYGKEGPGHG